MALLGSSGLGLIKMLFSERLQAPELSSKMGSSFLSKAEQDILSNLDEVEADRLFLTKVYQYFMNDYYSADISNGDDYMCSKSTQPLHYEEWEFIDKLFDDTSPFPRSEPQNKGLQLLNKTMEGFALEVLTDAKQILKSKDVGDKHEHQLNNNSFKLIVLVEDPPITENRGEFCTTAQILMIGLLACKIKPYLIPCSDLDYELMDTILSLEKGKITAAKKDVYSKLIRTVFNEALKKPDPESSLVLLDIDPDIIKTEEFINVAKNSGHHVIDFTHSRFDSCNTKRKAVRNLLHYIFDLLNKLKHSSVPVYKTDEWKREWYSGDQNIPYLREFQNFNYNELIAEKPKSKLPTKITTFTEVDNLEKDESIFLEDSSEEFWLKLKSRKEPFGAALQQLRTMSRERIIDIRVPGPSEQVNKGLARKRLNSLLFRIRSFLCSCCAINSVQPDSLKQSPEVQLSPNLNVRQTGAFLYDEGDDLE